MVGHIGNLFSNTQFPGCLSFPASFPHCPIGVFYGYLPDKLLFLKTLIAERPSGDTNEDSLQNKKRVGGAGRAANSNWSLLLSSSVDFKEGVPYRITVTTVSPWGLAPAPSVWKFREELGRWWAWRMEGSEILAEPDPLTLSRQYRYRGQWFGESRMPPQGPLP